MKSGQTKVLLSGIKPTGRLHIGNYFGAMKQFVDIQNNGIKGQDVMLYIMIADYHALNLIQNPEELRQNIKDITLDYLAIGLDTNKTTIFKQSDISAHTELAWIFDTITTMPYLMRAHAYKDAEAKNKEIVVGTFNYPMLMASDILLYDTDVVPVGQDQKQHVEYTRDTAEKFNRIFNCQTFKLPEPIIIEGVATVPGTDGKKMSKSYNNTIPLFATREEIVKAVMSIVTDSSSGIPENVYAIHKLFRKEDDLAKLYKDNSGKYKILKEALIEDIDSFISPLRKRRADLEKETDLIYKVLKDGADRARNIADKKMIEIKKNIGVN